MDIKQMKEKRAEILPRLYELRDLNANDEHAWTEENETNWSAVNKDFDELTAKIDRAERAEKIEADQLNVTELADKQDAENRQLGKPTSQDRSNALAGWMRGEKRATKEERESMQRLGVPMNAEYFDVNLGSTEQFNREKFYHKHPEKRATNFESTATGWGGETIPQGFVNRLENALLAFGSMLNTSEILRTGGGELLKWPTSNDTSNTGELIGEVQDSDDSAVTDLNITTSEMELSAFNYSSKLVRVSVSLLQDSAFDLAPWIGSRLGERLGRITNTHMTTGDGSSKPKGIVTASTAGPTSSSATAIDELDIINLQHSVDPAYRIMPGTGFMFHDNILKAIRKIQDTNGQFLWSDGLRGGIQPTIAGFPYQINQDMSSTITAADKTMLFGDLNKYKIRMVQGIRLRRLVERYAEFDQEGFVAFLRLDGDLLDAGTNPVKYLLQAGGGS